MTKAQWDSVINVHLHGSYSVTKAAWKHFYEQRYGRLLYFRLILFLES